MITQKKIRELPTYEHKSYKKGCGNGLFLWVGKNYRGVDGEMYGGKKYFKGRYKDSEIQIGIFGNRHGEMKLDEAQYKWNDIKQWSKDTGQKVGLYKKHLQKKIDVCLFLLSFWMQIEKKHGLHKQTLIVFGVITLLIINHSVYL